MKFYRVTIQMKATEQYFSVVLFIMMNEVVLTLESVDEILKCEYSTACSWFYFWVLRKFDFAY